MANPSSWAWLGALFTLLSHRSLPIGRIWKPLWCDRSYSSSVDLKFTLEPASWSIGSLRNRGLVYLEDLPVEVVILIGFPDFSHSETAFMTPLLD